jgi:hypothetical protein
MKRNMVVAVMTMMVMAVCVASAGPPRYSVSLFKDSDVGNVVAMNNEGEVLAFTLTGSPEFNDVVLHPQTLTRSGEHDLASKMRNLERQRTRQAGGLDEPKKVWTVAPPSKPDGANSR